MIHAIRSIRTQSQPLLSSPLPSYIGRRTSGVRFLQTRADSKQPENSDNMGNNQNENQAHKTGDVMSNSFGEGYATRSDEEGFGGIYGGNQFLPKKPQHDNVSHPEYDKSQGSEAKEKEKGRHQTSAAA